MKEKDIYKAQLVIVAGLLVLGFIFNLKEKINTATILTYVATILILVFLVIPPLGRLIVKGWFKLAEVLGFVNSRILLSLIFFIILFPIAILSRLASSNSLYRKKKAEGSMFRDRDHEYEAKDLEKGW